MRKPQPQNWPTYVVWQRPEEIVEANCDEVSFLPAKMLRCPVLHWWIYEEIVRGLKRYRGRRGRTGLKGIFVAVDVCFPKTAYQLVNDMYGYGEKSFFRPMGQWLTEQLMGSAVVQEEGFEGVVVRCLLGDKPSKHAWVPLRWWERWAWKVEAWLLEAWEGDYPFWIEFPFHDKTISQTREVTIKIIDVISEHPQIVKLPLHKATFFPAPQSIDRSIYPLVSEGHVILRAVKFPADQLEVIYLKHNKKHETWIYRGREPGNDAWEMVAQDTWMPLESNNFILLGRLINTSLGQRIVPGSMLLQVEYSK